MAQADTRVLEAAAKADVVEAPSVLVILVAKDGQASLPQCLVGLSKQTHARLGVLAVDIGSSDGSRGLLESALGPDRVIALEDDVGFAGAIDHALRSPQAERADYVLVLHDDTVLAPSAVVALLEAARRIEGVGVVGPKVLDLDNPEVLRNIGLSTDHFGYPYSPLEEGEIDQGQYDRIREVRFVSSCAMLISRQALTWVGPLDERFTAHFEDLDFCWRAQIAGLRVLMTPAAVAMNRRPTPVKDRVRPGGRGRKRYERERAALSCMLKNYGWLSLLWLLPTYFAVGLGRIALLAVNRRFEDVSQILSAWGWSVAHLPGTLSRRARVQAGRRVSDRSIRRAMAPAGYRLRRWAQASTQALLPRREAGPEDLVPASGWVRAGRYARAHPVFTASSAAVLLALVAYRHLFAASPLTGGALAAFPASARGFFQEFVSGLRHTGLGGAQAGSPALGLLGVGSVLSFGSPSLLQKILILGLPAGAAAGCYRAVRSLTVDRLPAAVAAACYGLSSAVLWGLSQGRLTALVLLAGMPWLSKKVAIAFQADLPVRPTRWIVGAAIGVAVLGSFFPGVVLSVLVLMGSCLLAGGRSVKRLRGAVLVVPAVALAGLLALPFALELVRSGGISLADQAGVPSFGALARLSLGRAPGSWWPAFYLPAAAALSLVFVAGPLKLPALRAAIAAAASTYLAWLAAAGYLPEALSNPTAYVAVAAFSYALLVGLGVASLVRGVARASFGYRQLGAALLMVFVASGLAAQAAQAAQGRWTIGGEDRISAVYPVIGPVSQPYRVLWIGRPDGEPFPSPGGAPTETVSAAGASVRLALTSPAGASGLDVGRPDGGQGYAYLRTALTQMLAGSIRHGGALLAPLGIRYLLARPGDLPFDTVLRLRRQVDLDQISDQGLIVFANSKAVPVASTVSGPGWIDPAFGPTLMRISQLARPSAHVLQAREDEGFAGISGPERSLVLLGQQFDSRWRLTAQRGGATVRPSKAFGWAVGFRSPAPGNFVVRFDGQGVRTAQIALLIALWAAALWLVKRPVRG